MDRHNFSQLTQVHPGPRARPGPQTSLTKYGRWVKRGLAPLVCPAFARLRFHVPARGRTAMDHSLSALRGEDMVPRDPSSRLLSFFDYLERPRDQHEYLG